MCSSFSNGKISKTGYIWLLAEVAPKVFNSVALNTLIFDASIPCLLPFKWRLELYTNIEHSFSNIAFGSWSSVASNAISGTKS